MWKTFAWSLYLYTTNRVLNSIRKMSGVYLICLAKLRRTYIYLSEELYPQRRYYIRVYFNILGFTLSREFTTFNAVVYNFNVNWIVLLNGEPLPSKDIRYRVTLDNTVQANNQWQNYEILRHCISVFNTFSSVSSTQIYSC